MKQKFMTKLTFIFISILLLLPGMIITAEDIYWENPEILSSRNVWFPLTASSSNLSVIMWQEFNKGSGDQGLISISLMVKDGGNAWNLYEEVLGPFPFIGDKVSVSSLVVDNNGSIYISIANSETGILIYSSIDAGNSFNLLGSPGGGDVSTVSPKLFITDQGKFILFVTQPLAGNPNSFNQESSLGITYSVSENGQSWSKYLPLVSSFDLSNVYLPYHVSNRGVEHVVFQASPSNSRFYQLYYISSRDSGRTWSSPSWITDVSKDVNRSVDFDNQRVFLTESSSEIYISWERKLGNGQASAYYGKLDIVDKNLSSFEHITGTGISTNPVNNPQIYLEQGNPVALWYNNIGQVVLAGKDNNEWLGIDIPGQTGGGLSNFCRFLVSENEMNIIWQSDTGGDSGLTILMPDKTAPDITISPVNFRTAALSQDIFTVSWDLPSDSSGIEGFSYSLDRNQNGVAPQRIMLRRRDDRLNSFIVDTDGEWYAHVRAVDYAGNWSNTSSSRFIRDTTPPGKVSFLDLDLDESGFLLSNTGSLKWSPPVGEIAAGYSYRIQYLADSDYEGSLLDFNILDTPGRSISGDLNFNLYNQDNGLWSFTVNSFDAVGNRGKPETIYLRMNKYVPVTYITSLTANQDDLGIITMDILGRGFTVGGEISTIILDRDKQEPYDYIYEPETGYFNVVSDRKITGLTINEIDEGSYNIGLIHPTRGLIFNKEILEFESTGTVKFGNFSILDNDRDSNIILRKLLTLSVNTIFFAVVMILLGLMLIFAFFRIIALAREGSMIKMEVNALVNNKKLPSEKKIERLRDMKKRGMGLRIKFAVLVTSLVLLVVLMVSWSLSVFTISTQQRNLTDALSQTTKVLISSVNTSAGKYLQENNTLELKRLPSQIESMDAARFLTISGPGLDTVDNGAVEYLWVTNDKSIDDKVNLESFKSEEDAIAGLPGGNRFVEGSLAMNDALSENIAKLAEKINSEGSATLGVLSTELARLQGIASDLSRKARTESDIDEIRKMQDEIIMLSDKIDNKLTEIGNYFGSVPEFDPENILTNATEYTFYSPIVYQQRGQTGKYYQGTVRLQISTEEIIKEIETSRDALIKRSVYVALIAITLGIVGALILASIIISPINHLLRKVEEIRDSTDHLKLKNFKVDIKTHDEISDLAGAVTQMSKGLYKAALANQELLVGKGVQKQFLPLEKDDKGEKTAIAKLDTEYVEFFGYYEGAKGVSGDYFDFLELDKDRFAVIKCDISGKGVSASLIMAAVATIFHSYFNDWNRNNEKRKIIAAQKKLKLKPDIPKIDQLVYSINELVESMGFKGRFAAFIIVYVDTLTGKTIFCNAGDNLVHIYKKSKGKMEIKTIPEAPAAGVFPNDMVEMTAGFKLVPYQMDPGDIIFLFTDGIEEAQRHFRTSDLKILECADEEHEHVENSTHKAGQDFEEFGVPRMQAIVQAVLNKDKFELFKFHNEYSNEVYNFDFSTCEGTFQEAVIALLAIERVYRLYKDPSAGAGDTISVDGNIMEFMKEHFMEFDLFFSNQLDIAEGEHSLMFSHAKEDEQFDDLTILALRRK
ncbi:MAG: SpoIIE family protein phosphatase [Spirochaetales bacterium]|nr:SpoIIE family protein phosphatase [Spirochaetales bacterium]